MEVLQQIKAANSLQSHINATTPASQEITQGSNVVTTTTEQHMTNVDHLQLGEITESSLLELQNLDHCAGVTNDNVSLGDIILGSSKSNDIASNKISDSNAQLAAHNSIDVISAPNADFTDDFLVNQDVETVEESPQINVAINNVVCTFSTRCHLNLRHIALNADNVELKKAQGMLNMKLRTPSATASIWSSGKITVTGANSEANSRIAARRIARKLQKVGFDVKFSSYKIVNVLGTCSLPFGILLTEFSRANIGTVQYEPELHPGATYQISDIHATLKIFSTGSITITAPKVDNIQIAVERIFPLVYPFKKPKKVDPNEIARIERLYESLSETEVISDNSDLDLEPGEIPSTRSRRFDVRGRVQGPPSKRMRSRPPQAFNADDYGSSSNDDLDVDSDESFE